MVRWAWRATVQGVTELDTTEWLTHTHKHIQGTINISKEGDKRKKGKGKLQRKTYDKEKVLLKTARHEENQERITSGSVSN